MQRRGDRRSWIADRRSCFFSSIQFIWEIVCLYRNARAARSCLQCRSGDHRSPLFHSFIHAATTDRRYNSTQSRIGKPVRLFSCEEETRLQDAREQARSSAIHWTDLWGQRSLPMKMSLRQPLLIFCLLETANLKLETSFHILHLLADLLHLGLCFDDRLRDARVVGF